MLKKSTSGILSKWSASSISLDQSKWLLKGVQNRQFVLAHQFVLASDVIPLLKATTSTEWHGNSFSLMDSTERCLSLIHFSSKILFCGCSWLYIRVGAGRSGAGVFKKYLCGQTSRLTIHVKMKHCTVGQVMCAYLSLHLILVGAKWHKHLLVHDLLVFAVGFDKICIFRFSLVLSN